MYLGFVTGYIGVDSGVDIRWGQLRHRVPYTMFLLNTVSDLAGTRQFGLENKLSKCSRWHMLPVLLVLYFMGRPQRKERKVSLDWLALVSAPLVWLGLACTPRPPPIIIFLSFDEQWPWACRYTNRVSPGFEGGGGVMTENSRNQYCTLSEISH